MPELPEVETLCRQLRRVIVGQRILDLRIMDPKIGTIPEVSGCIVGGVVRRGKGLEMDLGSGMALHLHLRMSGNLLWQSDDGLPPDHTRFIMTVDKGRLLLIDPRRFATVSLGAPSTSGQLPPFPLHENDLSRIFAMAQGRQIPVKAFLLDQRVMAGLGNIYACEILYEAAIEPARRTCDLALFEWRRIAKVAAPILRRAIRARGTTVSDWHDLFGQKGENQHHLNVYGRENKPCPRCGVLVVRKKLCGRGTYSCPSCQK
jgi:formamidopyrimidine-DNA glycosylase